MNREDFNLLKTDIVYLDNSATTLKPLCLSQAISDYYNKYSANIHRGDYNISLKAEEMYENTRIKVAEYINAKKNEIVFTSGTTDSLNKLVFGFFKDYLKENDEIILSKSEHASNILPWFELATKNKLKINYVELNEQYEVTLESIKKTITNNTKVISLAYITNVIGDVRPIKEIIEYAHQHNILVVVDAAQSIAHKKIDVKALDLDFLAFSAHKMMGPTGVGVLYAKYELLNKVKPIIFGGGMNNSFDELMNREYHDVPYSLEAGTPNIAGVIGFNSIIDYINNIGIDKIEEYVLSLKNYLIDKLENNSNIIIYNKNSQSGIVTLNYKNIFAQDLAIYLNKHNICVRAGNHCAKILKQEIGVKNTCRISLYLYNNKEDIDRLVEALSNPNIFNELI